MTSPVPVRLRSGIAPTPMQRGLLASQRRYPTQPLQNMTLVTRLDGPIDADRLAAAFASVVAATDLLRTRVVDLEGNAHIQIADDPRESEIIDLPADAVSDWAVRRARRVVDLSQGCYDSAILRHGDGTASWYLALHHAVTDATSSLLVFEATAAAYDGEPPEPSDYYEWWASREDDRRTKAAAAHWAERSDAPRTGQLYLPVSRSTPASHRQGIQVGDELSHKIADRLAGDMAAMSDDLGWTTLLVTVAAVYLNRLTGSTEMAIGLPIHNRARPETRRIIGPLMEVFPVDVSIEDADSFRSLYQRVARAVMATLRHARLGTAPPTADCEAIVNVIPRVGLGDFGGVPATTEWVHSGASDPAHLFRLQLTTYGEGPELLVDLNDAAADEQHRDRAPGHIVRIVEAIVSDPDRPLRSGTLCDVDELALIRSWGSGPDPAPVADSILPELESALADVEAIVIEHGDVRLTGAQLWDRVTAMARWLTAQGVGRRPGPNRVGLELERNLDVVVAILGTLVAGGSYVPLDPEQPAERRRRLAQRADCVLVLDELPPLDHGSDPFVAPDVRPDDEAYLLFTSGSTGEPKGVPITHRGLAGYLRFAIDSYVEPGVPPVAPLFSALTFDLTVTSLFVPLLAGGRIVVIEPNGSSGLAALARRSDLTWWKATPSHLEVLLRLDPTCDLRTLVVGGEAFPARLARRLLRRFPNLRVFNEYGPTEAVVGCMIHEATLEGLDNAVDVPIGTPAPGVSLRVVDADLHDVPIGAQGELLISHPGLTAGYLDDGGTPDAFVEVEGARWYRSGDLVRLSDPETLVYHGRIDEQIKTGGIRLEPVEVESALTAHPAIERSAVRLWSPRPTPPSQHCVRCGLPSNVPGIEFDARGVCATCHDYDRIKVQAASYFRTPDDLRQIRDRARRDRSGPYDCLHLLSGGKDSTYALYQLVELGFSVRTMTLDNGFISEGAKDNVRQSTSELGVDHEFVTSDVMNEIFRDSLERHSNVCHGCYKTMYTLATTRAEELGIPVIVTGLSRGQLFETRLVPQQFGRDRFDPDAIDRAVIEARRSYHRIDDGPNRLLDTSVFESGDVFDRISYVDFYRYVDVELSEMYEYLERSAPWVRPADTGRSTNCLINAAGIHTHIAEQGYHNYAIPYAWDVRLGHKTRQEAIDELDDDLDMVSVGEMLGEVGYEPTARQVLTAWYELSTDATEPQPAELRSFLSEKLPTFAIPSGFVAVDELPMTSNGKLDADLLPPPSRVHRSGPSLEVASETPLESAVVSIYERLLQIEPVGVTDDFFDLGGDSLAALALAVAVSEHLGRTVREEIVFVNTTPRSLASAIDVLASDADESDESAAGSTTVPTRAAGAPPPLGPAEQAMLFEALDDPADPRFNVGHLFRIQADLDVPRFVDALRTVVAHQPTLHWTYADERRHLSADDAIDVLVRSGTVDDADLSGVLRRFHLAPLDLEDGPIGRCVVQPLTDGSIAVLIVIHHIAIDAGSFDLLWQQIDDVYGGRELAPIELDYADHAAWQQERNVDVDLSDWLRDESTGEIELGPADAESPTQRGGYLQRTATFTTDELRAGPGTTPFATALGALSTVMRRRCSSDRVPIGLTVSSREHPAASGTVGLFLNTVPIETTVAGSATRAEVAVEADEAVSRALRARAVPLSRIVSARRRAGLAAPPVNVLLAYEDWAPCRLGAVPVDHEVLGTGSPVADATFFVQVRGDEVVLSIEHRSSVLDESAAEVLLDEFEASIRASIERPLSTITEQRVATVSGPRLDPDDRPLHALIDEQVARDPGQQAVRCGDEVLTYGALDARSNQIANELRAAGVGRGHKVGIVAERRPDTIAAIIAVLKAGAAYVAIDPAYPAERISHIVADGEMSVVLVSIADRVPEGLAGRTRVILLDSPDLDERSTERPDLAVDPDDLAYLIYTSGSTGVPKGVMVRHRNIVASTNARSHVYPKPVERFLLLSSFAFDSSMVGLFWTLCTGATVVLPPEGRQDDILEIASIIDRYRITHLLALPSLYRLILTEGDRRQFRSLDTVIVAGENCGYDVVTLHRDVCTRATLANEYGPTEGTVWSHVFVVDDMLTGDPVPIGEPIPGVAHVVLGESGLPAAPGEPGELYLGGTGVAAGYQGRPGLTAERFVEIDGVGDGPWYRTGDIVQLDDLGRLVFLGRADDQIKVRGVRVEPAEVETALRGCAGVGDAVVGVAGPREQLTAWFVPEREPAPSGSELRAALARLLPEQLVPAHLIAVPEFPLGANGKIDRRALSAIEADEPTASTGVKSPIDGRTALLAGIWADVLGLTDVAPDDNFFDLGGDSIISLQIVARARRSGIDLRPRQVFEHQTVRELAAAAGAPTAPVERPPASGEVELTPIQRWFFDQDLANPDHWNQTLDLAVDPATDIEMLVAALDDVRRHHEQLRCRFVADDGVPRQYIVDEPAPVVLRYVDLDDADEGDALAELDAGLRLEAGQLVGLLVVRHAGAPRRVVLTVHHLVVDGVSWSAIVEDWAAAYDARAGGGEVEFSHRSMSFQAWSRRLGSLATAGRFARTRSFWRPDSAGSSAERALRDDDVNTEAAAVVVKRVIDHETTTKLLGASSAEGDSALSVEDVLLTAVALCVPTQLGHAHLGLVLEGHGREDLDDASIDPSRTVGWFTTQFPVEILLAGADETAATVRAVRDQVRAIPDRGLGYGVDRYLAGELDDVAGAMPVVAFNYLGQLDRAVRPVGPFVAVGELRASIAPENRRGHLLGILAAVQDGCLSIAVDHHPAHLSAPEAAELVDRIEVTLVRLIEAVASDSRARFDLLDQSDDDAAQLQVLLDQLD